MQIRAAEPADLQQLNDIDGTVESSHYLHLERSGEGVTQSWKLEERALRTKLIDPNPMDDETKFAIKQIAGGMDEGLALVAEHEGIVVASLVAAAQPTNGTFRLIDLRVDYDHRGQGVGSAMLFQSIQEARNRELRAVATQTKTNNMPANGFLLKRGFDLAGLDTQFQSNHDLVKEAVTLFWYAAIT